MVIFIIIVVKYWEDFMICVRGEGHIPYDLNLKEESKYFQSDAYWKDVKKDEERKKKRQRIIEKAKKKTEEQSRPLFVGYFRGDQNDKENEDYLEESKIQERSATSGKQENQPEKQKKGRKKKRGNFKNY